MEASVKLLHDCVRQLQVPTSQAQPHSLPQAQPVPPHELSVQPPLPLMEQEQEQQQEPQQLPEQPQPQPGAQPPTPNCSTLAESTFTRGSLRPAGEFLSANKLLNIRTSSSSRRNFATHVMRILFSIHERKTSNVNWKNKDQLDTIRIGYVKKVTFQHFPLKGDEIERKVWSS